MTAPLVVCCRCRCVLGTDDAPLRELCAGHDCPADHPAPPALVRHGFMVGRFLAAATAAGVAVLLGAVLLLLVALAASGGRYSASVVLSGSMRPSLSPGDVAILQKVPVSSLRVGDVIAYMPPSQTVARIHRIVSINGAKVQTKGDANGSADAPVLLKGSDAYRLVATVPYVGWLWGARAALWLIAGAALLLACGLALGREVVPLIVRR